MIVAKEGKKKRSYLLMKTQLPLGPSVGLIHLCLRILLIDIFYASDVIYPELVTDWGHVSQLFVRKKNKKKTVAMTVYSTESALAYSV